MEGGAEKGKEREGEGEKEGRGRKRREGKREGRREKDKRPMGSNCAGMQRELREPYLSLPNSCLTRLLQRINYKMVK